MNYVPDKWVILKIIWKDETTYKVFGSWKGGYLDGDSWRMNSGIKSVETHPLHDDILFFNGFSGSVYECSKESYGATVYGASVCYGMMERATENKAVMTALSEEEALSLEWVKDIRP